jgi:hypothetical protein
VSPLSFRPALRATLSAVLRAALRAMPWLVTVGAIAFGSWFFRRMIPLIPGHDRLAALLIPVILLRATAAIGAVSAGAFALAAGLEGRWLSTEPRWRRRFAGLATLGAASMAVGAFIIVGPMAGFPIARTLGVLCIAGGLAGLSAWSAWSLRRRLEATNAPAEVGAPSPTDGLFTSELGRVNTPVT